MVFTTSPGRRTTASLLSRTDVRRLTPFLHFFIELTSSSRLDMPAKTVIFDQRCKIISDFGLNPRNTIAYNPQGRLLLVAGFGNLAGQVDIYDRQTLKKVVTLEAPNTVHCEWSADGRYLLCATLSPRLRVDNGIKIYHFTGGLLHVEPIEELYQVRTTSFLPFSVTSADLFFLLQASWRPANPAFWPMSGPLEGAPQGAITVTAAAAPKPAGSSLSSLPSPSQCTDGFFFIAAGGAYRPPHARGTTTSNVYKREDEGGAAYSSNGVDPFPRSTGGNNGTAVPGAGRAARPRTIPGAPGAAPAEDPLANRRKKKGGKGKNGENGSAPNSGASTPLPPPVPVVEVIPEPEPSAASLSPEDKKRRAIIKKLTAIEQLKEKKASGEKLELTQHKKLDGEAELRKELAALG